MSQIKNTFELSVGTRVAILMESRNGASITGHNDDTAVTISKIKEDGSVYLKGSTAPTSVAFKENSNGAFEYTKSEKYSSTKHIIVSVEFAQNLSARWTRERKIRNKFKSNMETKFSIEEMEKINDFIASMENGE